MKTPIQNLFFSPVLIAALGLILAGRVTAQTFMTLHSFTPTSGPDSTNDDGVNPNCLILTNNTLYGTARGGGSSGLGTVFKVNTNGTSFTNLYSFSAIDPNYYTNSDGANPLGVILSGNTLYGTAHSGGSYDAGTAFAVDTDGNGFANLHSFGNNNNEGFVPPAGVILSGNTLYGTAQNGGSANYGTVFALNTNGTGFTNLHSFTSASGTFYTNSDGIAPFAGLILSGNILYGTADSGGSWGKGTVFAVNTNGTGFTTLHSFTPLNNNTNSDGANPHSGLILSGNNLYGTAVLGGSSGLGTVFKVNTDGTSFTNLHSFTLLNNNTNGDGAYPQAGLILSGSTLYGTAVGGGNSGNGTVFAIHTDGSGFINLHSFKATPPYPYNTNSDGANPVAGLILSGSTLYGTAVAGGNSGNGTVFSLSLPVSPPQLTIIRSVANVILTWPTNYAGFTLQSTANLVSSVWTTNSPAPVVVNGQNTVTNPISGTGRFFRLSQ